jgi:hypothetical protein
MAKEARPAGCENPLRNGKKHAMEQTTPDRMLIVSSRLAEGYQLTESAIKNLQHIFTTWFPRAVYTDLTPDTVHVRVVVKKSMITSKNEFNASFLGADGSVIKSNSYDQDRMVGKVCLHYDQSKTKYQGKKDGFDERAIYYVADPATIKNRPA